MKMKLPPPAACPGAACLDAACLVVLCPAVLCHADWLCESGSGRTPVDRLVELTANMARAASPNKAPNAGNGRFTIFSSDVFASLRPGSVAAAPRSRSYDPTRAGGESRVKKGTIRSQKWLSEAGG
jgi:hypothetical protein